jgi:hypothetical protein
MKGLMGKLKGMPIKQVLLNHAEKIVLGTAGLIVLAALASTTWGGIEKQPQELMDNATKAGQALHTGPWPQDEQAKFTESTYANMAVAMSTKLADPGGRISEMFAYDKPMSFPLYKRIDPKTEVTWPVVTMMIADAGQMIMATEKEAPLPEEMPEGEEDAVPADNPRLPAKAAAGHASGKAAKGHAAAKGASPADLMLNSQSTMMAGDALGGAGSSITPRGINYIAVRGIVELDQFHKAIRDALRLDQLDEARSYLEFMDVKVQRQKAVAGPTPWLDANWEDVDIAKADEVFQECQLAPDIVQLELTDPVITMPLPARLDKDYTDIVSHPFIKDFQLSKEQRDQQEKLIRALQDEAGENGGNGNKPPRRRGFSGVTEDIKGMKEDYLSNNGGDMSAVYKRAGMAGPGAGGRPGPGQPPMSGSGQLTLLPPPKGKSSGMHGAGSMPGMPGAPGMQGRPGQAGVQQAGLAAVGYVYLLRYLDFDVNPGEAYRYRVKLVVANPNYREQVDKVRNASDAEGETRDTGWSEPTAPAVIKTDTSVFLTKLDERNRYRGEAEMKIFQWDPQLGTYIDGEIRVKPGQFVSGLGESERLDLATPSLEKKTVLFASKQFLVDTSLPTKIIPSEHEDLKLAVDRPNNPTTLGAPFEALVMNEYGEVHMLDSESSKSEMAKIDKQVKEERKPWLALKDVAKAQTSLDGPEAAAPGMIMPTGTSSTKKKKKKGQAGAMGPGMMGPGMMGAGMQNDPAGAKGKKGKASSMHAKK